MKNKKLFAILTLVCFMFTLMPVAAFAAVGTAPEVATIDKDGITFESVAKNYLVKVEDGKAVTLSTWGPHEAVLGDQYALVANPGNYNPNGEDFTGNVYTVQQKDVDLQAAAVEAAGAAGENWTTVAEKQSYVWTADAEATVKAGTSEAAEVKLQVWNRYSEAINAEALYVWATTVDSNIPVESLNVYTTKTADDVYKGLVTDMVEINDSDDKTYVYKLEGDVKSFYVGFLTTGTFEIHVSATEPAIESGKIASAKEFQTLAGKDTVTVYSDADDTKLFVIDTNIVGTVTAVDETQSTGSAIADGETLSSLYIDANNVDEKEVKIKLYKTEGGKAAAYKTIDIEVAGAIDTNVDKVTTDMLGEATFKVSGNREGVYKIYLSTGKYESVIEVVVGAIAANSIKAEGETAPYDILSEADFGEVIEFTMYDVNGNKLDPATDKEGWVKAAVKAGQTNYNGLDVSGYVSIVEQPAASKLTNKDLYFDGDTVVIANGKKITAEGEYTFKVVLDNGAFATASCVVKAFDKPVKVVIDVDKNIELGSSTVVDTDWVDANGVVEPDTKGVEVVATGYAVESFKNNVLTAKSDEKYEGSVITITAVDERYNLIASEQVTIAKAASELAFATKTAAVNVNNYIDVDVVDADGKVVSLGGDEAEISYVILDKPEGANVFVTTYEEFDGSTFTMNLTSNKVGNVAVQAILKYTEEADSDENTNVVKYYTGSQIFAVGTEGVGDVVVMSVGSSEIVINDAKATIDAAPIVENNRTFVPFRALAEAFGATVAYDEATQAVTAELNGVTVVMTIGSAEYTVNGEAKTADVAPFINGSRTMVPVRFAAEAFGIKVIPTYDENGATADILFNL